MMKRLIRAGIFGTFGGCPWTDDDASGRVLIVRIGRIMVQFQIEKVERARG